jgi:DNA-binding NtrC family response regulator
MQMGALAEELSLRGFVDRRADECTVRILLIEESSDYAQIVHWALLHTDRGSFEVEQASAIEQARERIESEAYDAILLDLGLHEGHDAAPSIDAASELAHRVPVIVLTGTQREDLPRCRNGQDIEAFISQQQIDCEALPGTILHAVQRHRRLGQSGVDPIVYRMHD